MPWLIIPKNILKSLYKKKSSYEIENHKEV